MKLPGDARARLMGWTIASLLVVGAPVGPMHATGNRLPPDAEEIAARSPMDIQLKLMPFLMAWGGRDDGSPAWTDLSFAEETVSDQARTVIAVIEANHAEYPDEEMSAVALAVLQAAVTIADPYDVFFEPDRPAHALLAEYTPMGLQRLLAGQGSAEAGEALRAAMRVAWKDYRGRNDLSGMIGEESPNAIERWLFEEPSTQMAEAAVLDLAKVCQPAFTPIWACQRPSGQKVDALCLGSGKDRPVQFRTTTPGDEPEWTLPEAPKPATEVMELWLNDTTLVAQLKEGQQSLTVSRAEGPMGTDGRVATEFNMNPGRPSDCTIMIDSIADHFADLIPRDELSDGTQLPLTVSDGHWRGEIELANGRTGELVGADQRLHFIPSDGTNGWLYLPRDNEVYMYDTKADQGVVEPDWRAPWLLPAEVVQALKVVVVGERPATVAGNEVRCFQLSGLDENYGDIEGNDQWLSGDICLTEDGIPMKVNLKGGHELQGQDEILPWRFSYEMKTLQRSKQPEAAFAPPAISVWNRAG